MRSSYLKRGFGFPLVVLYLGLTHGQATAGDGTAGAYRLLYLFDPAIATQATRSAELGDRVAGRPGIHVIGIVRGEFADSGLSVGSELPYETLTMSEAVKRGGPVVSEDARLWLSRVYQQAGDFVAIDNGAALELAGAGDEFDEVVGAFLNLRRTAIRTEVDFSTWGKVKELFR